MEKGQIVYAGGSYGVILDVFQNDGGRKVYCIHFAKNAARLQPPEVQPEENLVGLRPATQEELDTEINGLKAMIGDRIRQLKSAIVEPALASAD